MESISYIITWEKVKVKIKYLDCKSRELKQEISRMLSVL